MFSTKACNFSIEPDPIWMVRYASPSFQGFREQQSKGYLDTRCIANNDEGREATIYLSFEASDSNILNKTRSQASVAAVFYEAITLRPRISV